MSLMGGGEIEELKGNLVPLGGQPQRFEVHGATLDLTVGEIFIPQSKDGDLGGAKKPRSSYQLSPGNTAIIRTAETIKLPKDIAAIGFPPSTRVSLSGLLMTNPGHVDPGYYGQLHLTVINMGRESFGLARGQRIMRLMLFRLAADADVNPNWAPSPINEELLARLSQDFLSVSERVKSAVTIGGWRLIAINAVIPVIVALITAMAGVYLSTQDLKSQIARADAKVDSIGSKVDLGSIEKRLADLEKRTSSSSSAQPPR